MTLPRELVVYRALAVELVEYACGYGHGRSEADAVYQAVTEGRDRGAQQRSYSSCGDLAHWLLFRLGVRAHWENRKEGDGWRWGHDNNITLLESCPAAVRDPPTGTRYDPGDVGIIWGTGTDAHVFVVLDDQQPVARLYVGEYGQPGGHLAARAVGHLNGQLTIGTRALHRVLPLAAVLEQAAAAGALAELETASAWAKRLGLPPPAPAPHLENQARS